MLQNAYLDAKIGGDPAENEPKGKSDGVVARLLSRRVAPGCAAFRHRDAAFLTALADQALVRARVSAAPSRDGLQVPRGLKQSIF